jgi:hypothetical protein
MVAARLIRTLLKRSCPAVINWMPTGVAPDHQPIAVMLDLVNPVGARGRTVSSGWEAGLDEARGRSKQHAALFRWPRPGVESVGPLGALQSLGGPYAPARHAAN